LIVSPKGTVRFVYDDALIPVAALGETKIERASYVEPLPEGGGWQADMGPVGGPILGPFPTHRAAIQAEREWLSQNGF
jgi:hypothetical protein